MKLRSTIIALVVLIALGAFVYFYELPKREENEAAELTADKVFTIDWEKLEEIRIQRFKQTVNLRKEGEYWQIYQPVRDLGDTFNINTFIQELQDLKSERVMQDVSERLTDFKLVHPDIKLTVKTAETSQTLLIGSDNPVSGSRFVKLEAADQVLVVPSSIYQTANKDINSLRNKRIFRGLEAASLETIEIFQGDRQLFALTDIDGYWMITQPIQAPADKQAVEKLINYLLYLNVAVFYTEKAQSLAGYELDPPKYRIVLGEKEKKWPALLVGKFVEGQANVLAKRDDKDPIVLLPKDLPDKITPSLFDLRNKQVISSEPEDIRRIELKTEADSIIVDNLDGRWVFSGENEGEPDQEKIAELIKKLFDLKSLEFFENVTEPEKFGFKQPSYSIRLMKDSEKVIVDLLIGTARDDEKVFLLRLPDHQIMTVDLTIIQQLPKSWQDLLPAPPAKETGETENNQLEEDAGEIPPV